MTNAQKKLAEKKADLALCKLQDLFYDYAISSYVAERLERACNAVGDVITAIENTETTSVKLKKP